MNTHDRNTFRVVMTLIVFATGWPATTPLQAFQTNRIGAEQLYRPIVDGNETNGSVSFW